VRFALAALTCLVAAGAGCASTHDRAAKMAVAAADTAPAKLSIKANDAVKSKVVALLTAADGTTAVVVELHLDDPSRSLVWAPIDVRLYDAGGNVVGQANVDGADPAMVHVPSVAGGGDALYVNDFLNPSAPAVRADVVLGGTLQTLPKQPGVLETDVKSAVDPTYGPSFSGTVTNTTGETQQSVIVQVVARKGATVIAAGTASVGRLEPGQSQAYNGLFVGNPAGGEVTATAPVSNVAGQGAPAG
jgi:hypothetical protein